MYFLSVTLCMAAAAGLSWQMLHIFQLEGYLPGPAFRWIGHNWRRVFLRPEYLVTLAVAVVNLFCPYEAVNLCLGLGAAVYAWIMAVRTTAGKAVKKKLAYTKRVRRLIGAMAFIWLLTLALSALEINAMPLVALLCPAYPLAAGWAMKPLEDAINRSYFNDAKRILAEHEGLIRIGITGSYGKTSTKFILAQLLSEKYRVLATPSSFNTPMGITRVVREQLRPEHEVFIAEMGARHVGDIAELCELVAPQYGLITSVGKQHLETFFTLENIISTKYELIDALPPDGFAFFANDAGTVKGMYDRTKKPAMLTGFEDGCAVTARDVTVGPEGSAFTLVVGDESVRVKTRLLGRHNIGNILLCCGAAWKLGVTLPQMRSALARLEPVEHRLQLIKGASGMTVIDDAFNSNPVGAKAALDVLAGFSGKRVVITPGMVELGEEERALNRDFGKYMQGRVDAVILMGGKRTEPISDGLREGGFDMANVVAVESMSQALAALPRFAGAGDVVLFENDLPDNY